MTGPCGYGRHVDNPDRITCPRAFAATTRCVARDGRGALADDSTCVGCAAVPGALLSELDRAAGGVTILDVARRTRQARIAIVADAVQRRVRQLTQRFAVTPR